MKPSLLFYLLFICMFQSTIYGQENDAQEKSISGFVKNADNQPLRNVDIFLDSTKTSVKTNKNGYYEIIPKKKVNSITVFSSKHGLLGITYSGQKKVNFVFPAGNKEVKKRELAQLGFKNVRGTKKNELNYEGHKQSNSTFNTIYEMLEGRLPNVSVSGESITVRRAVTSFSASIGEPLLLVNNTPVQSISDIAPIDVKSVKVLTDSEASYYGSRAAYGVVSITLK